MVSNQERKKNFVRDNAMSTWPKPISGSAEPRPPFFRHLCPVFQMHRALEILEIVQLISDQVHSSPANEARPALASLARVCRFLSDPALDCLWRTQDTLVNILRCMSRCMGADERGEQ